jgi:integrase
MTVREAEALKDGVWGDGGNLWLVVTGKARRWTFRYKSPTTGKRREMGLGSYRTVPLAKARDKARAARQLLDDGIDPIDHQKRQAADRRAAAKTFEAAAEAYMKDKAAGWTDRRAVPVWRSSLKRFAYPVIGDRLVGSVTTEDVLRILRPIWTTKTETADRVRGRLERILEYATTHKWMKGENPARWKGHLANILPSRASVARVEHHGAVHWRRVSEVMAALERSKGMAATAVRFVCLTAARSGEVRGARWQEFDLDRALWTVPAERMKAKKEHRVPLSEEALTTLRSVSLTGDTTAPSSGALLAFPGAKAGRPLSDVGLLKAVHTAMGKKDATVHGFRSTFRDWVAEATDYPGEVAEMALAHAIGSKVEAAYRRGDLFEKRREMMEAWGKWCCPSQALANGSRNQSQNSG